MGGCGLMGVGDLSGRRGSARPPFSAARALARSTQCACALFLSPPRPGGRGGGTAPPTPPSTWLDPGVAMPGVAGPIGGVGRPPGATDSSERRGGERGRRRAAAGTAPAPLSSGCCCGASSPPTSPPPARAPRAHSKMRPQLLTARCLLLVVDGGVGGVSGWAGARARGRRRRQGGGGGATGGGAGRGRTRADTP